MTIDQIKEIVEDEIDDTVSDTSISAWVYMALVEISKLYGQIKEWSIAADADEFYDLPSDCLNTVGVYDGEGKDYFDYTISEFGQVLFDDEDTYNVQYFAMPAALPADSVAMLATTPAVHEIFHPTIIDWCKHKFWDKEADANGEESRFADKFKLSFYQQINDAALVLKNRSRKRSKIRRV